MIEKEIKKLLKVSLRKSDGTLTTFAKKYGIQSYNDFYKFYKDLKEDFKEDRENFAFEKITEQFKSAVGRLSPGLGEFGAAVFVLRTTGYILDDLKRLSKVINILNEEEKEVTESITLFETLLTEEEKIGNILSNLRKVLKDKYSLAVSYAKGKYKQIREIISKGGTQNIASEIVEEAKNISSSSVRSTIEKLTNKSKEIIQKSRNTKTIGIAAFLLALASGIIYAFKKRGNEEFKLESLTESMKDIIPPELEKKVRDRDWRRKIYKKFGKRAFLDPDNLEYPVYDENGPNCSLIYAAYVRANQWHRRKFVEKAINMYKRNGCEKKLGIKIHED